VAVIDLVHQQLNLMFLKRVQGGVALARGCAQADHEGERAQQENLPNDWWFLLAVQKEDLGVLAQAGIARQALLLIGLLQLKQGYFV
jgi:hypothetical protein